MPKSTGKGGIRQKLGFAKRAAAKAAPVRSEPIGRQLTKMYGEGKIASGEVGKIAAIALSAASSSSGQESLARLAKAAPKRMKVTKSGKRVPDTKNTSRALKRVLKTDSVLAPTYIADVTMWDTSADEKTIGKMAFLPIREVLEAVVPPSEEDEWALYTPKQN